VKESSHCTSGGELYYMNLAEFGAHLLRTRDLLLCHFATGPLLYKNTNDVGSSTSLSGK